MAPGCRGARHFAPLERGFVRSDRGPRRSRGAQLGAMGAGRNGDEATANRLGRALRAARGREPMREVQARTGISDSALSAYETGRRPPPRQFLEVLDQAYDQHGALLALAHIEAWRPVGSPATVHRWVIPTSWRGPVWCCLRPSGGPVDVQFRWGPWARDVGSRSEPPDRPEQTDPAEQTYAMVVNRSASDEAGDRVLSCETGSPTWARWGTGQAPAVLRAVDISDGWYPWEDTVLLRVAGQLLMDALAHCNRTTAELAEFLGVELEVVEALGTGRPLGRSTGA